MNLDAIIENLNPDKPSTQLEVAKLRLLQAQLVQGQDILQQLQRIASLLEREEPMKDDKKAPAKGKTKKCVTCKKTYAGKECPHCAKAGSGKGKMTY